MNLFGAVSCITSAVRPQIPATIRVSNGSIVNGDGSTTPQFTDVLLWVQVQALSASDLQQIENLSQQSDMRAVYIRGGIKALNRPLQYGGDIINFYGSDWLVTQPLEEWGDCEWCKIAVTRQTPKPEACRSA